MYSNSKYHNRLFPAVHLQVVINQMHLLIASWHIKTQDFRRHVLTPVLVPCSSFGKRVQRNLDNFVFFLKTFDITIQQWKLEMQVADRSGFESNGAFYVPIQKFSVHTLKLDVITQQKRNWNHSLEMSCVHTCVMARTGGSRSIQMWINQNHGKFSLLETKLVSLERNCTLISKFASIEQIGTCYYLFGWTRTHLYFWQRDPCIWSITACIHPSSPPRALSRRGVALVHHGVSIGRGSFHIDGVLESHV